MSSGLVHIYTGDGKGKSTAAIGLGLRATGNDMKVLLVSFLKGMDTCEEIAISKIDNFEQIKEVKTNKFTWNMNDKELIEVTKNHNNSLMQAIKKSKNIDILIFDEIISTYNLNLIDKKLLLNFIRNKPNGLEIILTGRQPAEELLELADYVSEVNCIKHPYEKGIPARKGIEF